MNKIQDNLIDALNRLDESADLGNTEYKEKKQQEKDYKLLFNYIVKSTQRGECKHKWDKSTMQCINRGRYYYEV